MWYKIEEIEAKYGLSKFSIYALITQEPELRKYIKAMEGVLQVSEDGISVLLKHASKKAEHDGPVTLADNNTVVISRGDAKTDQEPEPKEPTDLFADAFNSDDGFFEASDAPVVGESLIEEENFFSNLEFEDHSPQGTEKEDRTPSLDELVFPDELDSLDDEQDPSEDVFDDTHHDDDFFSDQPTVEDDYLSGSSETVINAPSDEEYSMEGYIKALKEKMVIQNEQIRALSGYLDVSKRMLVQEEKIVNIIEGLGKKK